MLSLAMIVKNEEKVLERCLQSVREFVNEIVIVDTGSTDKTKQIARKYTDNVYDFPWTDNFAQARNFSLDKCSETWILVLDADEIIHPGDMKKIRKILSATSHRGFYLIQRNYTNDSSRKHWRPLQQGKYRGYVHNPILRLFRNDPSIRYRGAVHETISMQAPVLDIPIHHYYEEKSLKDRQLHYLKIAEKVLEKEENGRLHYYAGTIHMHFTQEYDTAMHHFEKAAEQGYKKNEAREAIAQCLVLKKEFKKAYDVYRALVKEGYVTASLCNNLANLLVMHGHYQKAIHFLKKALELGNPNKERIENNIKVLQSKIQDSI